MSGSARAEVNGWRCRECQTVLYAVHVDEGVTPMMLGCREEGCSGVGVSLMYPSPPVPNHILDRVTWEWYRPTERWARRRGKGMLDHVRKGGLVIRELTDEGRTVIEGLRA